MAPWRALGQGEFLLFPDNTLQTSHLKVAPLALVSFTQKASIKIMSILLLVRHLLYSNYLPTCIVHHQTHLVLAKSNYAKLLYCIKYYLIILLYIKINKYTVFVRICKCEKGYVADTPRTFLDAVAVNHNGSSSWGL